MSSTNRGAVRERDDFYATPAWAADLILRELTLSRPLGRVIDPAAGTGALLDRAREAGAIETCGIELDLGRANAAHKKGHAVYCGDALSGTTWEPFDLCLMNPPFSHALPFVEHAVAQMRPGGRVAALLRLAFLESAERLAFHRAHPADVHALSRRPSFLTTEQKRRMHKEALERWRAELEAWQRSRVGEEPKRPSPPGTDSAAYAWFVWGLGGGKWSVLG